MIWHAGTARLGHMIRCVIWHGDWHSKIVRIWWRAPWLSGSDDDVALIYPNDVAVQMICSDSFARWSRFVRINQVNRIFGSTPLVSLGFLPERTTGFDFFGPVRLRNFTIPVWVYPVFGPAWTVARSSICVMTSSLPSHTRTRRTMVLVRFWFGLYVYD